MSSLTERYVKVESQIRTENFPTPQFGGEAFELIATFLVDREWVVIYLDDADPRLMIEIITSTGNEWFEFEDDEIDSDSARKIKTQLEKMGSKLKHRP